ncbi:MAG TPA: MgtC/SapB family protein [Thermoanaerobaculia bacterium]|nr:MgtC/SapB family protein [Thermoanaerobaculia bacterium]
MENVFRLLPSAAEWEVLVRVVIATLAGAAVGWNRHRAGKPAGMGTHALVALGAALFVAIPAHLAGGQASDAMSRVIQGVATGIGFLGAGEIFRDPGPAGSVQGLTSAAAIWATAALGVLAVVGSWGTIAVVTLLILLVLVLAPRAERKYPSTGGAGGGRRP